MKTAALLFVVLIGMINSSTSTSIEGKADKKVMVCYWGAWSAYRNGARCKFDVSNIDPNLCTHYIYAFTTLNETSSEIIPVDPWYDLCADEWSGCAYKKFVALKEKNKDLKTLVGFGGWDDAGNSKYSKLVADPAKRSAFTKSVVDFLLLHKFDGLDFDWEYPAAYPGGQPEDKVNFISMIRELKEALGPHNLMLTAAIAPGEATAESAYDIPAMASILDQFHVMGYDYHGAWESFTGQNAPLYVNPNIDFGKYAGYSVDYIVNYYLKKGVPSSKMVLLMPLYGRGWILNDGSGTGYYEVAYRPLPPGTCTYQSGFWGYNELCANLENPAQSWTIVRDNVYYQAPYAHSTTRNWIGYDDVMSLTLKAEYAKANGLLGAGVWSIDTDDFSGSCTSSSETFPLTKAIVKVLNRAN